MKSKITATLAVTFSVFGATYALLVASSRMGENAYTAAGLLLATLSVVSFVLADSSREKPFASNMWGILSGLFFWGFTGEFLEAREWVTLADHHFFPVLLFAVFFLVFLVAKKRLADRFAFVFGHFVFIWSLHMWMIYQFGHLSRFHWSTYVSSGVAAGGSVFSFVMARRSERCSAGMAWTVAGLLSGWTVVEYLWGWRVIPGPYLF